MLSDAHAARAKQVVATTEEQQQILNEVKGNIQGLSDIASELQETSRRFTINNIIQFRNEAGFFNKCEKSSLCLV